MSANTQHTSTLSLHCALLVYLVSPRREEEEEEEEEQHAPNDKGASFASAAEQSEPRPLTPLTHYLYLGSAHLQELTSK